MATKTRERDFSARGACQDRDKPDEKKNRRKNNQCYNGGKKGHFARDCWYKRAEGNAATSSHKNYSEEEWDFQASAAIYSEMLTEDDSREEELAASCIAEPEEATLISVNDKVINYENDWIVDSACSNHMTGDEKKLSSITE